MSHYRPTCGYCGYTFAGWVTASRWVRHRDRCRKKQERLAEKGRIHR